ncbi:UNVERIFIED_CONTAM: Capzb [Trichonephila clavipes]
MTEQQLDCALDLMRRLPPQQIEKNLSDLIDLVPSLCEDLLSSVDQPLKIARDKNLGKDYLLCDYNRDGDSYRSPWSNTYDPPLDDGAMPSDRLRKLEIDANEAFDQYREMYFEGGVSSVYLWDLEHGFAGVILIKKAGDGSKKIKGCWDSIHVVEVQENFNQAMQKKNHFLFHVVDPILVHTFIYCQLGELSLYWTEDQYRKTSYWCNLAPFFSLFIAKGVN